MPTLARQNRFSLTVAAPDMSEHSEFQVLAFNGNEAISEPYAFDVELVSERMDLDMEALLHNPAFLAFDAFGNGIHGQVYRIALSSPGERFSRYCLTLVPHLAYLAHRTNQRIFQHMNVQQIIEQLLEEHGIFSNAYAFTQLSPYKAREYCVQYGESDLHFIQRLCFEEGLHFHFTHSPQGHVLVFGDKQTAFSVLRGATPFVQGNGLVELDSSINGFTVQLQTRTNSVLHRDYNFEKASHIFQVESRTTLNERALENYTYPGGFSERRHGERLNHVALEHHQAQSRHASGRSDQLSLRSGHFVTMVEHPNAAWNVRWLLTHIRHEGKQPQVLEEYAAPLKSELDHGFTQGYRNSFQATPHEVTWRPQKVYEKPRILGSQTARVTGPAGEEIHCDQYGRVKVLFHWDRLGQSNDNSSCWLRVSSNWAGDRYGSVTLPRVGMEVLVTFLEGDPDQPLICGCVINSVNRAPLDLPANKTQSIFRSRSTPGGAGYNELRIDDRRGNEQIYLHAQRDMAQHIENDSRLQIDGKREETITGNSVKVFNAEDHLSVSGDRKVRVNADDYLSVVNSVHTRVGEIITIEAGQQISLQAGATLVMDGGALLSAGAGGQHLQLTPAGIFCSTPIMLGGVPIPGLPAASAQPEALGGLVALALMAQKQAFESAALTAQAVCPLCQSYEGVRG